MKRAFLFFLIAGFQLFLPQSALAEGFLRFNLVHHYLELHGENQRSSAGSDLRVFNFGSGSTPFGMDLSVGAGKKNDYYLYGRLRYVGEQNIISPTPLDDRNVNASTGTELTQFKNFFALTINYDKAVRVESLEFLFGGHLGYSTVSVENPNLGVSGFSQNVAGIVLGYQVGLNWYLTDSFAFNFMIDRPYFFAAEKVGAEALFGSGSDETTLVLVGNFNTRFGVQYNF